MLELFRRVDRSGPCFWLSEFEDEIFCLYFHNLESIMENQGFTLSVSSYHYDMIRFI